MWTQKPKFSHFLQILAHVTTVHTFMPNFKDKVQLPEIKSSSSPEICVQSLPQTACWWLIETEEKQLLPLKHTTSNLCTFQNKPDIPTNDMSRQRVKKDSQSKMQVKRGQKE